jgi:hypothetical protein
LIAALFTVAVDVVRTDILVSRPLFVLEKDVAGVEETPTGVKAQIDIKLLDALVVLHDGPVAANDVTDLADHRQILHSLSEASDETELGLGVSCFYTAVERLVHHFNGANEPVLPLVGMACIYDDSVEAHLLLAPWCGLRQLSVVHFASLFIAGVVLVWNLVLVVVYDHIIEIIL